MKESITKTVTLELNDSGIQARIPARQGDSLVYRVNVKLTLGGKRFSPEGVALAQVYAMLPDGSVVSSDCKGHRDGGYTFIPGTGFFRLGGPVLCRLVLRGDDGGEMYSSAFAFDTEICFGSDMEPIPAEEYSRIEELLLRVLDVKRECETIAAELGNITAVSTTISGRDSFIVYNAKDKNYVKVDWFSAGIAIQNFLDGKITAKALKDIEDTGYVATIPELEEDSVIALRSDIPSVPVQSVNGKVGAVSLGAADVGAAPAGKTITITGVDEDGVTHTWTVYGGTA